jgi:hypothetical protein
MRIATLALLLPLALFTVSCRAPETNIEPFGFGSLDPETLAGGSEAILADPVAEGDAARPKKPWSPVRRYFEERAKKEKDVPRLLLRAVFVQSLPDTFRNVGIEPDAGLKVLLPGPARRLLKRFEGAGNLLCLSSAELATHSGKPASIYVGHQHAYVKDFSARGAGDSFLVDPRVGRYDTGQSIAVLANVVEGKVVFRRVDARTTELLGVRTCTAEVTSGVPETGTITWQEPVLYLGAGSLPASVCEVEALQGGMIVLPLHYRIAQPSSQARALAKGGEVKESYENHFPSEGVSPLNLQTVLFLCVERVF